MMQTDATLDQLIEFVELNGVYVEQEIHGWPTTGVDMLFPHLIILLCLRGSARVLFDMQEMVIEKNDFGVLMPGHVLRRVSCSDDYVYASISISAEMVSELKGHTFSHDSDKFNYAPKCHLTDVQVKRMMALLELLEAIASHDRNDLQMRRPLLLTQLAVFPRVVLALTAATVWVLLPVDLIPDSLPFLGMLDDVTVAIFSGIVLKNSVEGHVQRRQ